MPAPASPAQPPSPSPSLLSGWARLALAGLFFWVLYLVTPTFIESFPPLREYAQAVEEVGVSPGVLFYTDVPVSIEAQRSNRDAIRFFVKEKRNQ